MQTNSPASTLSRTLKYFYYGSGIFMTNIALLTQQNNIINSPNKDELSHIVISSLGTFSCYLLALILGLTVSEEQAGGRRRDVTYISMLPFLLAPSMMLPYILTQQGSTLASIAITALILNSAPLLYLCSTDNTATRRPIEKPPSIKILILSYISSATLTAIIVRSNALTKAKQLNISEESALTTLSYFILILSAIKTASLVNDYRIQLQQESLPQNSFILFLSMQILQLASAYFLAANIAVKDGYILAPVIVNVIVLLLNIGHACLQRKPTKPALPTKNGSLTESVRTALTSIQKSHTLDTRYGTLPKPGNT